MLFIMCLETLCNKIREDKSIQGVRYKGKEIRIRACADDVMLIVEDPIENIPKILKMINEFGKCVGFKINKDKSAIITYNITKTKQEILQENTGIQIQKKVKYLGIQIMAK